MGKIKNKDEVAHYNMRLNLTNPDMLRVHQVLQDLNKDIYKSQNEYIFRSVLKNINSTPEDELLSITAREKIKNEGYVTRKELDEIERRVTEKVMKEVVTILCSSLVGRNPAVVSATVVQENETTIEERPSVETDATLLDMSGRWS